jgi:hypothetical protein
MKHPLDIDFTYFRRKGITPRISTCGSSISLSGPPSDEKKIVLTMPVMSDKVSIDSLLAAW